MNQNDYQKIVRKQLAWNTVAAVVALALVGILAYGFRYAQDFRSKQAAILSDREREPQKLLDQVAAERELNSRRASLTKVHNLVLLSQRMGVFVERLEELGRAHGIEVAVTDIKEYVPLNELGQPIVSEGPLQLAKLSFSAKGAPDSLLAYLFALEHAPYLFTVSQWSFDTEKLAVTGRLVPSPGADKQQTPAELRGEATVAIVKSNGYEAK